MQNINMLLALATFLSACDPDHPEIKDPCSIASLNGHTYAGFVNICNGVPQHQLYFKSELTILTADSLFYINLHSEDNSLNFTYSDTVSYQCIESEPNLFVFELYSSNRNIGTVGSEAQIVSIELQNIPLCENNSSFEGVLVH